MPVYEKKVSARDVCVCKHQLITWTQSPGQEVEYHGDGESDRDSHNEGKVQYLVALGHHLRR